MGFRYHCALLLIVGRSSVKPYAAYAIGAALVDTEIQVTDDELSSMGVEKGMMTRKEMWGRRGKDWEEQERQIMEEEKRMAELRREVLGE